MQQQIQPGQGDSTPNRWRTTSAILVGGDKAGNWSGWCRVAVPQAEQAYAEHLKRIDGEDGAR